MVVPMTMSDRFEGFSKGTVEFLLDLRENNDRAWFEANRDRYDRCIMEPSRAFVIAMGDRLRELSPRMVADPKVNGSLFRMNRDVRFSKDKSPYKTNLGIIFWEGPGKRMERPCFYFHLEEDTLMLAGGMYMIPDDLIGRYRDVVSEEGPAGELDGIVRSLSKEGMEIGGLHYKRPLKDHPETHPYSYLLRHNGVYGMVTTGIPEEFFSEGLIDMCFSTFRRMDPINRWFLRHVC